MADVGVSVISSDELAEAIEKKELSPSVLAQGKGTVSGTAASVFGTVFASNGDPTCPEELAVDP